MPQFIFDGETSDYSIPNAYWLARASSLAYQNEANIKSEIENDWQIKQFTLKIFDVKDTFAFLLETEEMMLVAFRGTNSLVDWLDNINLELVAGPGGKVHEGFYTALNCIWVDLYRYILQERGTRSLWLTGHSLGAALATLATAKLRLERDEPVQGLHTFGQPRTGDRNFARHFNEDFARQTFRHVNNVDVVARVPFRSMGYSHVKNIKFFDVNGNLRDDISWFYILRQRIYGRFQDLLKPGTAGIKAHEMKNYIANLEKLLP